MQVTNKTDHYELPIFVSTDVPTWMGDWNNTIGDTGQYEKIGLYADE